MACPSPRGLQHKGSIYGCYKGYSFCSAVSHSPIADLFSLPLLLFWNHILKEKTKKGFLGNLGKLRFLTSTSFNMEVKLLKGLFQTRTEHQEGCSKSHHHHHGVLEYCCPDLKCEFRCKFWIWSLLTRMLLSISF